jgi:hypothetical protein
MYPLADLLKTLDWYGMGKTPLEIAVAVAQLAQRHGAVIETDLSRMDGRVSNVLREMERKFIGAAYHPSTVAEVLQLHSKQYNIKGRMPFGEAYDTGYSRLSGSPETSVFNGLANCFIAYTALRQERVAGHYRTPEEAYASLGLYAGDDGISPRIAENVYENAARDVGQVLKVVVKQPPQTVQFLARIYGPNVWQGDPTSMCDVKRQISKFHATPHMGRLNSVEKLVYKSQSFYLTDAETPLIGPFVRTVMRLADGQDLKPLLDDEKEHLTSWFSFQYPDPEVQYPNTYSDWMNDYLYESLPSFDQSKFDDWLYAVKTLDDCLRPPIVAELPVRRPKKNRVSVNGVPIEPEESDVRPSTAKTNPSKQPVQGTTRVTKSQDKAKRPRRRKPGREGT